MWLVYETNANEFRTKSNREVINGPTNVLIDSGPTHVSSEKNPIFTSELFLDSWFEYGKKRAHRVDRPNERNLVHLPTAVVNNVPNWGSMKPHMVQFRMSVLPVFFTFLFKKVAPSVGDVLWLCEKYNKTRGLMWYMNIPTDDLVAVNQRSLTDSGAPQFDLVLVGDRWQGRNTVVVSGCAEHHINKPPRCIILRPSGLDRCPEQRDWKSFE